MHMSVASPSHAAMSATPLLSRWRQAVRRSQEGRRPRLHFRGLLRLHSNYGPLDRSTAQGGLCHRASIHPVTRTNRLPATRSNRQLSGWFVRIRRGPTDGAGRNDRPRARHRTIGIRRVLNVVMIVSARQAAHHHDSGQAAKRQGPAKDVYMTATGTKPKNPCRRGKVHTCRPDFRLSSSRARGRRSPWLGGR